MLTYASVFPLITALLFALYQIMTRKLAGRENPFTTLFFTALVGTVAASLMLPFSWQTPSLTQAALMVAIGCLGGLGHFLLIRAVEIASPTALAPFVYTQLVWSTLLALHRFRRVPDLVSPARHARDHRAAGLLAVNWQRMRRRAEAVERAPIRQVPQEAGEQANAESTATPTATFSAIPTRWMDNDVYGHVNNVVYYSYFDTVVNQYLIQQGALDIENSQVVGLVVETGCQYFAPIAFPDRRDTPACV